MSLNHLQERILRSLLMKIGAGPAAFYFDSCTLRELHTAFLAAPLLIAHALRETRSGIEERLRADPSVDPMLLNSLSALRGKLHAVAHRRGLHTPQTYGDEVRIISDEIDVDFDSLLRSYTPHT